MKKRKTTGVATNHRSDCIRDDKSVAEFEWQFLGTDSMKLQECVGYIRYYGITVDYRRRMTYERRVRRVYIYLKCQLNSS